MPRFRVDDGYEIRHDAAQFPVDTHAEIFVLEIDRRGAFSFERLDRAGTEHPTVTRIAFDRYDLPLERAAPVAVKWQFAQSRDQAIDRRAGGVGFAVDRSSD